MDGYTGDRDFLPTLHVLRLAMPLQTRATLTIACVVGFSWPAVSVSQSRPAFAAASTITSGNGASCNVAVGTALSTQYNGLSATVLSAPMTTFNGALFGTPMASVAWRSSESRRWRVTTDAAVGPANADCSTLSAASRGYVQLARAGRHSGVAISYGSRSLSSVDPGLDRQGITATAWRSMGNAIVTADVRGYRRGTSVFRNYTEAWRTFEDTMYSVQADSMERRPRRELVRDSADVEEPRHALDLRARLQWKRGRVALDVIAGGTAGTIDRYRQAQSRVDTMPSSERPLRTTPFALQSWARAEVQFVATSFLRLNAGLAMLPERPLHGTPGRRVALFGLAFDGLPRRAVSSNDASPRSVALFESIRQDSAIVIVRLCVPDATHVELSGEPTSWTPIAMQRANDGWWEAPLRAQPGTYRMNVRIDGKRWSAPPGTVPTRDEFGGEVGVMQLR